jgi:hypothetical protein
MKIAGRAVGAPHGLRARQPRPQSPLNGKFLLLYVVLEEVTEEQGSV